MLFSATAAMRVFSQAAYFHATRARYDIFRADIRYFGVIA